MRRDAIRPRQELLQEHLNSKETYYTGFEYYALGSMEFSPVKVEARIKQAVSRLSAKFETLLDEQDVNPGHKNDYLMRQFRAEAKELFEKSRKARLQQSRLKYVKRQLVSHPKSLEDVVRRVEEAQEALFAVGYSSGDKCKNYDHGRTEFGVLDGQFLLHIAPMISDVLAELKHPYFDGGDRLVRTIHTFPQMLRTDGPFSKDDFSKLSLAYFGEKALPLILSLSPNRGGGSGHIDYDIALEDIFSKPNIEKYLNGFPIDQAKSVIDDLVWSYSLPSRRTVKNPTGDVKPFFWKLMRQDNLKWCGLRGYLDALRSELKTKVGDCKYEYSKYEQYISDHTTEILAQLGAPIKISLDLLSKILLENGRSDLVSNDPFHILNARKYQDIHAKAVKKARELLPSAKIMPFDEFITHKHSSPGCEISGLKYFIDKFNESGQRLQLVDRIASLVGPRFFGAESYSKSSIEHYLSVLPILSELQGLLDPRHLTWLLNIVYDSENHYYHEKAERLIEIFSNEKVWKKFRLPTELNKQRIEQLTRIVTGDAGDYGVYKMVAEKEVSLPLMHAVAEYSLWRAFKEELPFGKEFMKGLIHNSYDTYRLLRTMCFQPGFVTFLSGMMKTLSNPDNARSYSLATPYHYYAVLEGIVDRKKVLKGSKAEVATILKLSKQMQMISSGVEKRSRSSEDGPFSYYSNSDEENCRKMSVAERAMYEAREKQIAQITSRQVNRTLRKMWDKAVTFGLEQILGQKYAGAIDDNVRQGVGVYYTSERSPDLQTHLKEILRDYVSGKQFDQMQFTQNKQYLRSLRSVGINVVPWTKGFEKTISLSDRLRRHNEIREHHENEIREILAQYGISSLRIDDGIALAKEIVTDGHVLADLLTQYDALKNPDVQVPQKLATQVKIYVEKDPMKVIQMGDVVRNSCLAIGRGNTFSVIANAVDANKRVLYAKVGDKIVGRKLIALDDKNRLLQYKTYYGAFSQNLDEAFESFIADLAGKMKVQLANSGEVNKLVAKEWYNDSPQQFVYVPIVENQVLVQQ